MTPAQIRDKSEGEFEAAIRLTLSETPILVHRLPDTTDINKRTRVKVWVPSQPSDYIVRTSYKLFLAEVKGTENSKSISLDRLEPNQRCWLNYDSKCITENYYLFIRSFATNEWFKISSKDIAKWPNKTLKFSDLRINHLWDIPSRI